VRSAGAAARLAQMQNRPPKATPFCHIATPLQRRGVVAAACSRKEFRRRPNAESRRMP
jgi:hypothetical protein